MSASSTDSVADRDAGDESKDAGGEPAWEAQGPVRYSTDPRDFGWVRENIPCQAACPAQTNIPAYIRMIVERNYDRAYDVNALANVMPGVLGRICSRPCEDACRHAWPGNGDPVDICHLKRVAADLRGRDRAPPQLARPATGKRVAVVGAGPAGVAVAHDLSIFGHAVTVLERETRAGGMLAYGIPEFRLPRDVLDAELGAAAQFGVELKCGVAVGEGGGETSVAALLAEYDAVVLATGTMQAIKLPLSARDAAGPDPCRNTPGVAYGLDFLIDLHRGETKTVGERVAVIGGGFTAMDCTRVARRLGAAEVANHIRTTEEYIPVWDEEVAEAKREGVRIRGLRTPIDLEIGRDGRVAGVKFIRNRLGEWRQDGRRRAIPIEGTEFVEPCDTVLVCIGQHTDHRFLGAVDAALNRSGDMQVGDNGMTTVDGLFAAGDYVNGASTVIDAIGHGRAIATKVDAWLMGRERRRRAVKVTSVDGMFRERADDFVARQQMPMEPMETRFSSLDAEAEHGFGPAAAVVEGKRCYLCSLNFEIDVDNCIYCRYCIDVAPKNCIKLVEAVEIRKDGSYGALRETTDWSQVRAIWIDNAECIRCGACVEVCPTGCISVTRKELVVQDLE